MAKKVVNQVVIKDEELTPTTLGVYSNKGKSPIGLILIILIFLALLIFLPNIETYYNKLTGKDNEPTFTTDEEVTDDDDNNETEVKKYPISSDTVIEESNYTVSNIGFTSNILTLSIANNSTEALDLDDYYLELYNDKDVFVERVKVSEKVLASSSSDNFTYTIKTQPTQIVFIKRTKDDYPKVELRTNEMKQGVLSCIKANEQLIYTFSSDSLSKIKYEYTASNINDQNYSVELYNKQKSAQTYNTYSGVSAEVTNTGDGYKFIVDIVTSSQDIDNLDIDGMYKSGTLPSEIKFKEEAKGFTCN